MKSSQNGRDAFGRGRRQQPEADFATCTDQLTSNIYASLAAFQDVQENDVIDAVRGYLCRQPSPSSSRHRRPLTGRRPGSAADGDRSRTVQLRQGDVGPLSSLVVIRPATPQPRTYRLNGGPPTSNGGRPRTAAETATASVVRHRPPLRESGPDQPHQRFAVSSTTQASADFASQSIKRDDVWFSTFNCQQ